MEKPGKLSSVAIKVDLWVHTTGNILVEDSHYRKQLDGKSVKEHGWLYTCRADYLFVIDPVGNKMYQFNWKLLKAFVVEGDADVHRRDWDNKTDESTRSVAYTIKLEAIRKKQLLLKEWDI